MKEKMEVQKQTLKSAHIDVAPKKTLLIGWSRLAKLIADELIDNFSNIYEIVGFISIFPVEKRQKTYHRGIPLLGDVNQFQRILENVEVENVIIAIDPADRATIHKSVELCNKYNLNFEILNENYDILYGHTLKYIAHDVFQEWDFSPQRLVSIVFALSLIILFAPLFIMVALLIKLSSPGPIFYSQERVGKNGRLFRIIKFRTMIQNAEKVSGPQLATKNDPRITKIGKFLRKTRLDEIPQLINILLGDMAFIGPRPERPYFVEKYSRLIPFYKNRLKVKPGVTGLAQIYVGYDETIEDVEQKVKWDLYYIEHKSIFLNLKILWGTLITVLTMQGQ